ncbi:hypothetical protein ACTMTI_05165 [Nonomuraea sp. H19]|uniref:hypothetical protein n=1 Tax=Nonomuraea sp. H19 TaxID=3452206 RepID=UPI003F8B7469
MRPPSGRRGGAAPYLDGAIMAIPSAIGTADAVILYSGPRSAFDLHEPALRSLGAGTTYLGGDHGLSSLYDVVTALLGHEQASAADIHATAQEGLRLVREKREMLLALLAANRE